MEKFLQLLLGDQDLPTYAAYSLFSPQLYLYVLKH